MRTGFRIEEEISVYQPVKPSLLKQTLRAFSIVLLIIVLIAALIVFAVVYQQVKVGKPTSDFNQKTCSYVPGSTASVVDEHEIRFGECK